MPGLVQKEKMRMEQQNNTIEVYTYILNRINMSRSIINEGFKVHVDQKIIKNI